MAAILGIAASQVAALQNSEAPRASNRMLHGRREFHAKRGRGAAQSSQVCNFDLEPT